MTDKFATFNQDGTLRHRLIKGVHPIPESATPVDDQLWVRLVQETDGQWVIGADGEITKQPLPEAVQDAVQLIAHTRFQHETAGIAINGIAIDTGRDSQALITGATLSAVLDPNYVCTWKAVSGPVELTAEQLISVATAVRAHVQACFDREGALLVAVAEGSYTAAMLNEGWPV